MASTRFFFELCIFSVALHFAFAINARELRKINVRINKIETDHHRRINDLELEVQYLKLELDEQRTNGDGMSPGSESRGKKHFIIVVFLVLTGLPKRFQLH